MSTETLTLKVPVSLVQELESAREEFLVDLLERGLHQLKIDRALDHYAYGGISFGAESHLAEVSQSALARHAYARGMEPKVSVETLADELD